MKSYNARLKVNKDPRFSEWAIVLKTGAPVHKSTKLSWIEEIDEKADTNEISWYEHIVKFNVEKSDG
jgi:hypothetical protein